MKNNITALAKTPRGANTERKIFLAAIECISQLGIEKTSITQIAKRAKVARSLVSYYLPKKSDLILRSTQVWREILDTKAEPLPEDLTPLDRELQAAKNMIKGLDENPNFVSCALLMYYYSPLNKDMLEFCRIFNDRPEQNTFKNLKLENTIRKNQVSDGTLHQVAVQFANMRGMHLIKRFFMLVEDKEKYDQDLYAAMEFLWNSVFK